MTTQLAETLAMGARAASQAADPWRMIGNTAVMLHRAAVHHIRDIDPMMSTRDAEAFVRRVGGALCETEANDRFRSLVLGPGRIPLSPLKCLVALASP